MTRVDAAYQMVTCMKCKAHYRCTPSSDYYSNTTLEDGVCESCLLREAGFEEVDPIPTEIGTIIGKKKS